jgi:hypothetical protein
MGPGFRRGDWVGAVDFSALPGHVPPFAIGPAPLVKRWPRRMQPKGWGPTVRPRDT